MGEGVWAGHSEVNAERGSQSMSMVKTLVAAIYIYIYMCSNIKIYDVICFMCRKTGWETA